MTGQGTLVGSALSHPTTFRGAILSHIYDLMLDCFGEKQYIKNCHQQPWQASAPNLTVKSDMLLLSRLTLLQHQPPSSPKSTYKS